jgi:hypothetical protein
MRACAFFLCFVVAAYARQLTFANNLAEALTVHVSGPGFDLVTTVPASDVRTWSVARDATQVRADGLSGGVLPSTPLPLGHVFVAVSSGSATVSEVSGPVESDGEPSPGALIAAFVSGFLVIFGYGVWGSIKRMFREAD